MSEPRDTVVDPPVPVDVALRTDPGRDPDKRVNEDLGLHRATRFGYLCVVCDGMGGHANGQEASRAAVAAIEEVFDGAPGGSVSRDLLREAIVLAHKRIRALPVSPGEARPGSTVVAALLTPHGVEIAHVGDSRIYAIQRGQISQVTRDHSMVQLMVEAGMIKPEEAQTHPDANKIMRALGISPEIEVDLREEPLPYVAGDVLVLASDGLTDLVSDVEILSIASSAPVQQAAGQLVDLANARGGHDNITVIVARPREASVGGGARGVAKTVPLTAVEAPNPMARSSGGTLLAAPLLPPSPAAPASSLQPVATVPPSASRRSRPSPPVSFVVVGASLVAVIGVVVGVVALYFYLNPTEHHDPVIVTPLSALPGMRAVPDASAVADAESQEEASQLPLTPPLISPGATDAATPPLPHPAPPKPRPKH